MGIFKSNSAFPEVPSSLHHDTYEMQTETAQTRPPLPMYDSAGSVTPYLGLRARLSQVWFNRWTVLLLLVLVRVLILIAGLNDDIGDSKTQALSACTKVEDVGSAMASMPHYLSVGVNSVAADTISSTVQGMVELLLMILTGVQELIFFVINLYVGTYACLTSALVHGTLDIGIGAADEVTSTMNKAISGITTTISDNVSGVQDAINSAFSTIGSTASIFGKDLPVPTIDITSDLDDLKNIKIDDTSFVQSIKALNATLPTYDDAENFTRNVLAVPFTAVKNLLNTTYGNYTFDKSVFPVAQKQGLTFCSDNGTIDSFFTTLFALAAKAKTAFVVVLILLAVLACGLMSWIEIRRFRREQERARLLADHAYDPMDIVYIASRSHSAGAGIWLATRIGGPVKRQIFVRWLVAYATSLPALFVLSLALAGFVSCACQAALLGAVQREAPALSSEVANFAGDVVNTLQNVSQTWSDDANGVLLDFQGEINNDMLGYVTNATTAVNSTLNAFMSEIDDAISAVFNGTVLENTVTQVVRCLIGIKVDAVEKGLTWVHDHAHVTLPLFPNNTFSAGASDSINGDSSLTSFLASPSSVTSDEITGAVNKVVDFLRNSLIQDALVATALLLLYVLVVAIGLIRALLGNALPDRSHGSGGQRYGGAAALASIPEPLASTGNDASHGTVQGARFPAEKHDDYDYDFDHDVYATSVSSSSRGLEKPAKSATHWRHSDGFDDVTLNRDHR